MEKCISNVVIPTPIIELCAGDYKSTQCVLHPDAIPILDLPANSSVYDIIIKQNLAIQSNKAILDSILLRLTTANIP
jgi:hypothetical protein